jgi:hypothetical protein
VKVPLSRANCAASAHTRLFGQSLILSRPRTLRFASSPTAWTLKAHHRWRDGAGREKEAEQPTTCSLSFARRPDRQAQDSKEQVMKIVTPTILTEGLHIYYGQVHVLDGPDLVAEEGSVLGILGPKSLGRS